MTETVSQERTTGNEPLPAGWVWSEIGRVAELIRGVSYKKSDSSSSPRSGLLPILRANNIGDGKLNFDELVYVPPQQINEKQYVRALDVVIAMSSGSKKLVGKAGQAMKDFDGGFGAFCGLIRSSKLLDKRYVGFFFQSEIYRKAISELSSGVNINNLRRQHIEQMPIPLAPLNEQCRIVEKIDELFTKLDAGGRSLEQARDQLKSYRRSVLKAAVEGELSREWREAHGDELEPASELLDRILQERREKFTGKKYKEPASPDTSELPALPDGWDWASMGQFLTDIEAGKNFKCREQPPNDYELGLVKISSVTWGKFNEAESKTVTDLSKENPAHLINEGDFLFSRANTLELVGACVIVHSINKRLMLSDKVLRFQFVKDGLKSWILFYLRSHEGRQQIESLATGNQLSMRNISQASIQRIVIPLPSTAEMKFIVEEVERRLSVVDKLEATVDDNLKQAAGLRQSILKQAFSGELVPQDPDDEPASVLLARIRSEREATKPKAKRPRKVREDGEAQGRLI